MTNQLPSQSLSKRIILYARESTKWQAENGYNLVDQEKRMQRYCKAAYEDGTYTTEVFEEYGASAKNLNRPKMEELMKRINNQTVDTIMIYSIDRLSRSVADLANLVDLLEKQHIELVSVSEKIETHTPHGRFFISMLGSLAQLERENISSRTERSLLEAAKQGYYAKPRIPFGYQRNPKDKHTIIENPEQATYIKKIFDQVIEGTSASVIALRLRDKNVYNRKWTDNSIYTIVRNPIYYGAYEVQGQTIEQHSPAIVTKEEWQKANDSFKRSKSVVKHNYIFKGYVRCKKCGKIMETTCSYNHSGAFYIYYRCKTCGKYVSEKKLMERVDPQLTSIMREDKFNAELSVLKKNYRTKCKRLSLLNYTFFMYGLSELNYKKQKELLETEADDLIEKIDKLHKKIVKIDFSKLSLQQQRKFLYNSVQAVEISEKRSIVRIIETKKRNHSK